jgi:hypothetical protein
MNLPLKSLAPEVVEQMKMRDQRLLDSVLVTAISSFQHPGFLVQQPSSGDCHDRTT